MLLSVFFKIPSPFIDCSISSSFTYLSFFIHSQACRFLFLRPKMAKYIPSAKEVKGWQFLHYGMIRLNVLFITLEYLNGCLVHGSSS